jgi:hypothetical protein
MIERPNSFRIRLEELQRAFCAQYQAEYVQAPPEVNSGVALSTKGREPINGLRHPQGMDTTGWYIWFGDRFSEAPDFFEPVHTHHIYEDYPELAKLLGLPPGYRFLAASDYLDVWYDPSLLNI